MKNKLIHYPNLVKEFDTAKNKGIDISKLTYGQQLRVWWICNKYKEHQWQTSIYNRTRRKSKCPYCANQKVWKKNSLLYLYPNIAKEWHPKKNGRLLPKDVVAKSQKKYWWKCKRGHEWEARLASRTRTRKTGCPYCSNQKIGKDNNLKYLYPQVAKLWHPTKNGKIKPNMIAPRTTQKKYWWICPKGHEWENTPGGMTRRKSKKGFSCPYCDGKKISKDNNLQYLNPEVAKLWHPTKNGKIKPNTIAPKTSQKKYWWICPKGHEWENTPHGMTKTKSKKGFSCPYCSGHYIDKKNNLKYKYPKIAKEWDYEKNKNLTPETIHFGANKHVWWKCINGHSWRTRVANRTGPKKSGCPRCSKRISSFEIRLLSELEGLSFNVKPIHKINNREIDLFLSDLNIAIEFDGWYYHESRVQIDRQKNAFFNKKGIQIIRIREEPLKKLSNHDIVIKQNSLLKKDIDLLIKKISKISSIDNKKIIRYLSKNEFQFEKEYRKYLSFYPSPIPQRSLKESHPSLIKEWNYKKNHPLKPENFYTHSGKYVWWTCKKNHEFKMRIATRTYKTNPSKCPYCEGKKVDIKNSLYALYPSVAKEFHKTKNPKIATNTINPGSHKKYWWKCKNGHEWLSQVRVRTKQNSGCPHCHRLKFISKKNQQLTFN